MKFRYYQQKGINNDIELITYVGTCTAAPFIIKYDGTKAGKIIYYWLRWVNTRGEAGPWSTTINGMVAG